LNQPDSVPISAADCGKKPAPPLTMPLIRLYFLTASPDRDIGGQVAPDFPGFWVRR
jgi:hypothetical protein